MPVFEIKSPDGQVLEVEAPSQEAAISAIKEMGQDKKASLGHKVGALVDGIAQGITLGFSDEIAAGLSSGFGLIGDYQGNLDAERARMEENKRLAGGFSLAGELAGAVTGGVGLAKSGLSLAGKAAGKSLGKRSLAGGAEGALLGAGYGAGTSAEGDRASGALSGAMFGAGVGGAVPVVGAALSGVGKAAYGAVAPKVNAVIKPEAEAARRVGQAFKRDIQMNQMPLGAADEAIASKYGTGLINADRGGETVRALTRSVANQSPESRGVIERVASDRFAGQGARLGSMIDDIAGGKVDDLAFQDALLSKASRQNQGAYDRAFRFNFGENHSLVFDDLARRIPAQAMANAMKVAKAEGRPFGEQLVASIDEAANTVTFKRSPSMREWHYIQRGLRSAADNAYRSGAGEVGTAYKQLHREMLSAMDNANPAYQEARAGAARFFQAEDALDAGRKFVTQNKDLRQSSRAIASMKPAEKEAFKVGFAAELREAISKVSDRRNVINQIFGSEAARKKVELVFGRQGAKELQSFMKVETAADMMRGALGNSTTARQLVELGLGAGGGYFATGDLTGAAVGAALAKGARFAGAKAEENVMRRMADMLLSSKRSDLAKAAKAVKSSVAREKALDALMDHLESTARVSGSQQMALQ